MRIDLRIRVIKNSLDLRHDFLFTCLGVYAHFLFLSLSLDVLLICCQLRHGTLLLRSSAGIFDVVLENLVSIAIGYDLSLFHLR